MLEEIKDTVEPSTIGTTLTIRRYLKLHVFRPLMEVIG